jgi:hypothetical protein
MQSETAHFGAVEILPTMLAWLIAKDPDRVPARSARTVAHGAAQRVADGT